MISAGGYLWGMLVQIHKAFTYSFNTFNNCNASDKDWSNDSSIHIY